MLGKYAGITSLVLPRLASSNSGVFPFEQPFSSVACRSVRELAGAGRARARGDAARWGQAVRAVRGITRRAIGRRRHAGSGPGAGRTLTRRPSGANDLARGRRATGLPSGRETHVFARAASGIAIEAECRFTAWRRALERVASRPHRRCTRLARTHPKRRGSDAP